MKNIKKYILGFLATLMLCITSVVSVNNTQNEIVVNAEESSDMVYVGTPINPTETLNNVYFNTSLSDSDIINIISQLSGVVLTENEEYFISSNQSDGVAYPEQFIEILINRNDNIYAIVNGESSDDILWSYGYENRSNGWQTFNNPYTFESSVGLADDGNGMLLGQQNGLLSSLISSTPYYRVLKKLNINESMIGGLLGAITTGINGIISPIIKGIENGFNELFISGSYGTGTAINPTGTYDEIYFNTSLSDDEIVNILSQLEVDPNTGMYAVYSNLEGDGKFLAVCYLNNENAGILYNDIVIWGTSDFMGGVGWQVESPLSCDLSGGVSEFEGILIGQQNELLKNLISSTPFESNQTLTPIAYFLIGMLGLSIGIGLVWLVISIMKNRK